MLRSFTPLTSDNFELSEVTEGEISMGDLMKKHEMTEEDIKLQFINEAAPFIYFKLFILKT